MAKNTKQPSANDERLRLIDALKAASAAIDKSDNSGLSSFVTIRNKMLMAECDTFSIGVPVDTELEISVDGELFEAALKQCSAEFQMTQLSAHELSIKSGKFRAIIPVLADDTVALPAPDVENTGSLGQPFIDAVRATVKACSGKGELPMHQAIFLASGTCTATNGGLLLQAWHGFGMPTMSLPRKTALLLAKLEKEPAGFACSAASITFYFSDNSFIKSRLHTGEAPGSIEKLFVEHSQLPLQPLWQGFRDGLDAISKFVENDAIYFGAGFVKTADLIEHAKASYAVDGLPPGHVFSLIYWAIVLPYAEQITTPKPGLPWFFCNKTVRGLLMGKHG